MGSASLAVSDANDQHLDSSREATDNPETPIQEGKHTPTSILNSIAEMHRGHRLSLQRDLAHDRAAIERRIQEFTALLQAQQQKYDDENKQRSAQWTQHLQSLMAAHERDVERVEGEQKRQLESFVAVGRMIREQQEEWLGMKREVLELQLERYGEQIVALQGRFEVVSGHGHLD